MSTSMPGVFERLERPGHLVALHREQADFGLQREAFFLAAAGHLLVVPDHVFERERNLLPGFVLDDVGNLLRLDRRQLDEPRQAALARHGDRHAVARERRCARGTVCSASRISSSRVGVGLAENLGVFDVVERLDHDPLSSFRGPGSAAL